MAGRRALTRPAWWPSAREEALVRLALGLAIDREQAVTALEGAAAQPSAEEERLFALVFRRLIMAPEGDRADLDLSPAVVERLRRGWVESRALRVVALRQAAAVLAALHHEGIVAAPLKGLAMDAWFGLEGRPIGDLDLLVPEQRLDDAVRRLLAEGYTPHDEIDPDSARAKHSCALGVDDGAEVDLHWLLDVRLEGCAGRAAAVERFWRAALPDVLEGATVLRLRAEHHFFHAVVHGARVDSRAQARWAIDAVTILRRESARFDWDELVATAVVTRLTRSLGAALAWIESLGPGLVPAAVGDRLRSHPSGSAERLLWFLDSYSVAPGVVLDVQRTLRWHLAKSRRRGLVRGVLSYPHYLRASGLVTSPRVLLTHWRRRRREKQAREFA